MKEKKETGEYGFLYVEGCFPQPYEDYSLIYKYSLKDIYKNWREMKNLLFLCGGVFSLLLSLCLIALLNRLFHPLQQRRHRAIYEKCIAVKKKGRKRK